MVELVLRIRSAEVVTKLGARQIRVGQRFRTFAASNLERAAAISAWDRGDDIAPPIKLETDGVPRAKSMQWGARRRAVFCAISGGGELQGLPENPAIHVFRRQPWKGGN